MKSSSLKDAKPIRDSQIRRVPKVLDKTWAAETPESSNGNIDNGASFG